MLLLGAAHLQGEIVEKGQGESMSVARPLRSQPQARGLSSEEAVRRLATTGPNAIVEAAGPSHLRQFLANFVQLFALLLWAGALLALVAGMPQLTAAIVAVIAVNAVFSYV